MYRHLKFVKQNVFYKHAKLQNMNISKSVHNFGHHCIYCISIPPHSQSSLGSSPKKNTLKNNIQKIKIKEEEGQREIFPLILFLYVFNQILFCTYSGGQNCGHFLKFSRFATLHAYRKCSDSQVSNQLFPLVPLLYL